MYVRPNYPSKAALRRAVAAGETVTVWSPGPFPAPTDGETDVEGPWAPEPHRWYGGVTVVQGKVTAVR